MDKIECPRKNFHTKNCIVSILSDSPLIFSCECGCKFKRKDDFDWEILNPDMETR